jgi:hypothetical protein
LSFHSGLQGINRTTFERGAVPCVHRNIGSFQWVALAAADRIRRKKPFHAFEVSGRCSVTLVHVTATDPFCRRRHTDLVTHSIVANCGADRVRAMTNVVARESRIVSARISNAVVNGVMPVVIVIGVLSIPAAVVRLERIMRPALTSVSSRYRNALASESQRPHIRRVCVIDPRLDSRRVLLL